MGRSKPLGASPRPPHSRQQSWVSSYQPPHSYPTGSWASSLKVCLGVCSPQPGSTTPPRAPPNLPVVQEQVRGTEEVGMSH